MPSLTTKTAPRRVVLIVDDSRVVREQVVDALRGAGYDVVQAANGAQGLAIVKETPGLALAVCDVNMPVMGGLELLEALKTGGLLSFPVVMLTSEGQPELLARARSLGAKAWVMKPVVPESLVAVVTKLAR